MRFNPPMKLHLRGRETNRIEDSLGGRWEGLLAVKQRYAIPGTSPPQSDHPLERRAQQGVALNQWLAGTWRFSVSDAISDCNPFQRANSSSRCFSYCWNRS